jgi:hypothetical protein
VEEIAGVLDVGDGDRAHGVVDRGTALGELADLLVVGLAVRQCGGEDRGVGGDPDDVLVGDEALQVAAAQALARQVVEPDGDACGGQFGESAVAAPQEVLAKLRRAAATTSSVVKPNSRNKVW